MQMVLFKWQGHVFSWTWGLETLVWFHRCWRAWSGRTLRRMRFQLMLVHHRLARKHVLMRACFNAMRVAAREHDNAHVLPFDVLLSADPQSGVWRPVIPDSAYLEALPRGRTVEVDTVRKRVKDFWALATSPPPPATVGGGARLVPFFLSLYFSFSFSFFFCILRCVSHSPSRDAALRPRPRCRGLQYFSP